MKFGTHKGEPIVNFYDYDSQYIQWCFKNIVGFYGRLDEEDKLFLYKLAYPTYYLTRKYGNLNKIGDKRLLDIVREEGIIDYCSLWRDNEDSESFSYKIEGIFGLRCGSVSPLSDSPVSVSLREYVMSYIERGEDNDHFQNYIDKEPNN